jgi:hypothetical protein
MFLNSGLEEILLQLFDKNKPLYIYANSEYSYLYTILVTPFLQQYGILPSERQFNKKLACHQISIK